MVNFNPRITDIPCKYSRFQSLKGILVNFNLPTMKILFLKSFVSIPQRDFGEFQRYYTHSDLIEKVNTTFQSLKGILVNFNSKDALL
ncbi:Epoxyqueuosine (oQ) reductase QueG [Geitlerinema sp. FC II]|nr:Epoxyqueuosine (oQ) reductase QueG [Geitlerinema sp. FC II]